MKSLSPIHLPRWIQEHRHLLKPPVGNQLVWQDTDFIIMVVGGPNARTDFHVDPYEEFFYQLEGTMQLKCVIDGVIETIDIHQGEIFLLPANVPHSPRRPVNTVGLVVERTREPEVEEGFQWYCEQCEQLRYEVKVKAAHIVEDLPQILEQGHEQLQRTPCEHCQRSSA